MLGWAIAAHHVSRNQRLAAPAAARRPRARAPIARGRHSVFPAVCVSQVCANCYRIGNMLDVWYQRELLYAANATCASRGWADTNAAGIDRGVRLRRWLRLEWMRAPPPLLSIMYAAHAERLPAAAQLRQLRRLPQLRAQNCARDGHGGWVLSATYRTLAQLRGPLAESVHALLDAHPPLRDVRPAAGTCVVHVRVGDFVAELRDVARLHADDATLAAALVEAARSFAPAPERFELLESGSSHKCAGGGARCGAHLLAAVARALAAAFPAAPVAAVRLSTPDEDFARAARAPMLLVGMGGTFATFAAAVNRGQVRSPECVISGAMQSGDMGPGARCWPLAAPLPTLGTSEQHTASDWRVFAHPLCVRECYSSSARLR